MGFIYYIYSTHEKNTLYIGQDSRDDYFDPNNRIFEHARIAYGLKDGPYKGSETIMRNNSLSDVGVVCFDANDAPIQAALKEFSQYWTYNGNNQILDFAEMAHLVMRCCRDHFHIVNQQGGGYQCSWTLKNNFFTNINLPIEYQTLLNKQKNLKDITIQPMGSTVAITGLKMFEPQVYQIQRLISAYLTSTVFYNAQGLKPDFKKVLIKSLGHVEVSQGKLVVNRWTLENELEIFLTKAWVHETTKLCNYVPQWKALNLTCPDFDLTSLVNNLTKWFNERLANVVAAIGDTASDIVQKGLTNRTTKKIIKEVTGSKSMFELKRNMIITENTFKNIVKTVSSTTNYINSPYGKWLRILYAAYPNKFHHDPAFEHYFKEISYEMFRKAYQETVSNVKFPTTQPSLGAIQFLSGYEMKEINNGTLISRLEKKILQEYRIGGALSKWWWEYAHFMITYLGREQGYELKAHATFPTGPDPERARLEESEQALDSVSAYSPKTHILYEFSRTVFNEILEKQRAMLSSLFAY